MDPNNKFVLDPDPQKSNCLLPDGAEHGAQLGGVAAPRTLARKVLRLSCNVARLSYTRHTATPITWYL
jgi:hypothetical protein